MNATDNTAYSMFNPMRMMEQFTQAGCCDPMGMMSNNVHHLFPQMSSAMTSSPKMNDAIQKYMEMSSQNIEACVRSMNDLMFSTDPINVKMERQMATAREMMERYSAWAQQSLSNSSNV